MTDTITVVGNIATNPEVRTAGAFPVTSFRIATTERRLDAQGAWIDAHTNYYSVSAFRSLGDHAFVSFRKGDRIIVGGRLRLKEWTASDGSKGRTIEIDADMLGHDLRFGTSVFQRAGRTDASATTTDPGVADARSDGDADGTSWSTAAVGGAWAAPGVGESPEPDAAQEETTGSVTDRDRAFTLAGADTPF